MKALTATALLLALSAGALAKPNPVERPRLALVNADMSMGSVGAMRERDYFEAPQSLPDLAVEIERRCSESISGGGVWLVRYFTTLTVTFGQTGHSKVRLS